jgi:DNA-binding NarL/FixJ family response regulator
MAARCRGLVADDFDAAFAEALELHARTPAPFELARTLLAYGERLHRARRRVDARARLREGLETFKRLRARPWAERAQGELRAAGAVDRKPVDSPDELTAQELRISLAAAGGATNRQIAAELFLSPKTIEFHLGRVYRKLGIRSRTELAAKVADGALV